MHQGSYWEHSSRKLLIIRQLLLTILVFVLTSPRIITATASASQISFYVETGGEIQWLAAGSLASDPGGIHMLMTGLPVFIISLLAFFGAACLATPGFYDATDNLFAGVFNAFKQLRVFVFTGHRSYMRIPDESNLEGSLDEE